MEFVHCSAKLHLDFVDQSGLRRHMSKDTETRHEVIRRLFYLITIAAEDAAAMAVEGQSISSSPDHARSFAANLQELGMRVEILASTILELIEDVEKSDATT